MLDLWYKNAIFYCLDVETFRDANSDGIGDFQGLSDSLKYLDGLGITCLWLLPFYPSPNRDNGYDVMDYYNVDARLGTLGDFVVFMRQARERGLRVIIDLVVNHTSDQHPWFQAACRDRDSPYHDYYVWSDTKPAGADEHVIFPGEQESIWTYNEQAGKYYLHRFYKHQPDLNIGNPAVREEISRIMGFWLELGVSGFRLDAAPFLIELRGIEDTEETDPYNYLWDLREFVSWQRGDAILLAEANVAPEKITAYFGERADSPLPKLHMLFNFLVNQNLFLSLARQETAPLEAAFQAIPTIPEAGQWAYFIRNHDELDLGRLNREQREEVFQAFAPEPRMRLYDRGIRRRLPPMLDGDIRHIKMVYSLLFTLPGAPVLRYGEEIGMGDDLSLEERTSVRTAMQWSGARNGGFSSASPESLARPVIDHGPYDTQHVNVTDQRRDPNSLLNDIERMIRVRKEYPVIGRGTFSVLHSDNPAVLVHRCDWEGNGVLAVHNFAPEGCRIDLDHSDVVVENLVELLSNRQYPPTRETSDIELDGYGYRWFCVDSE